MYFFDFLTVFSICVALPVLIVWLIMRKSTNETNKLSQIIITAMEKNINIDIESVTKLLHKSPKKNIISKLLIGNICSCLGIAIAVFFIILAYCYNMAHLNDFTGFILLSGIILISLGIAYYITYFVEKKNNK